MPPPNFIPDLKVNLQSPPKQPSEISTGNLIIEEDCQDTVIDESNIVNVDDDHMKNLVKNFQNFFENAKLLMKNNIISSNENLKGTLKQHKNRDEGADINIYSQGMRNPLKFHT